MIELIRKRLEAIELKIAGAADKTGRKLSDIQVVCVSKRQPLESMLALEAVFRDRKVAPVFGENYVQEFQKKKEFLSPESSAHLIGPLQRNKAKEAVRLFDLIESVHSRELARALSAAAEKQGVVQSVLLQVNVSADPEKKGFLPEELPEFLLESPGLAGLRLEGLMTITRFYENSEDVRPDYRTMRELRNAMLERFPSSFANSQCELSMGMSADYDIAVEEGSTMVRIGSALFGPRE